MQTLRLSTLISIVLVTVVACGSSQKSSAGRREAHYSVTQVLAAFATQGIHLRKLKRQPISGSVVLSNGKRKQLVNVGIRLSKDGSKTFVFFTVSKRDRIARKANLIVAYSVSEAPAVGAALAKLADIQRPHG
jgi:hypothetical protein